MKKFTVLVVLALLVLSGTGYATDRSMAPQTEPTTTTIAPVLDRETLVAAGIDSTIDEKIVALESNVPPMMSEEISGPYGLVSVIVLAGVPHNLFMRPITPCRVVDTRVDGGPFTNGETRRYLLPGGVRCTSAIPPSAMSGEGVAVLLDVRMEADNYPWSWGDNGPTLDFIGTAYGPDWFGMHGERAFLFAKDEGLFPDTAKGKIRGFVALKSFPGLFTRYWGLEAQVKSQWAKSDFRAHVTIDIVGYAVPKFR